MLRAVALAASLLVVGCATAPDVPEMESCHELIATRDFTSDQFAAMKRAEARVNAIMIKQLCVTQGNADETRQNHVIFKVVHDSDRYRRIAENENAPEWFGVYYQGSDSIGVIDDLPIDQFERVVLHEMVHASGFLTHVEPPAMMAPNDGSADDFTANDIVECKRLQICKPDVVIPQAPPPPEQPSLNYDPCVSADGVIPVLCKSYDRMQDAPYPQP